MIIQQLDDMGEPPTPGQESLVHVCLTRELASSDGGTPAVNSAFSFPSPASAPWEDFFVPRVRINILVCRGRSQLVHVIDSQCPFLSEVFYFTLLFYFILCHTYGKQKLPGQGSNLPHSTNLSHCSDNAGALTRCATKELRK